MQLRRRAGAFTLFVSLIGCGSVEPASELSQIIGRDRTTAVADFDMLAQHFRSFYGPLEYKQKVQIEGFDFEGKVLELRGQLEDATYTQQEISTMLQDEERREYNKKLILAANDKITGAFKQLAAYVQDGHVSLDLPKHSGQLLRKKIGIGVLPFKGENEDWKTLVVNVEKEFSENGIEVGDVILTVDGKDPMDYLEIIKRYDHDGDETSMAKLAKVFSRDGYMTDLLAETKAEVEVTWKKGPKSPQKGQEKSASFVWKSEFAETYTEAYLPDAPSGSGYVPTDPGIAAALGTDSKFQRGMAEPFFFTPEVEKLLQTADFAGEDLRRKPATSVLKKFGLDDDSFQSVFGYRYQYEGKDVLLIRQPTYFPPAMAKAFAEGDSEKIMKIATDLVSSYKAVLYENKDADVLVIDQTYNPGGLTKYAVDFFRLFITKQANSLVSFNRADEKNYLALRQEVAREEEPAKKAKMQQALAGYEAARLSGRKLTDAQPLGSESYTAEPHSDMKFEGTDNFYWDKPVMVLTNAQSGSCGDIFPNLMARNKVAKIFGERTGGWGGNVETFTMPMTLGKVGITRGLFLTFNGSKKYEDYEPSEFLEGNGQPVSVGHDESGQPLEQNPFDRPLTVKDFHAGFTDYFKDFSKEATTL